MFFNQDYYNEIYKIDQLCLAFSIRFEIHIVIFLISFNFVFYKSNMHNFFKTNYHEYSMKIYFLFFQ